MFARLVGERSAKLSVMGNLIELMLITMGSAIGCVFISVLISYIRRTTKNRKLDNEALRLTEKFIAECHERAAKRRSNDTKQQG